MRCFELISCDSIWFDLNRMTIVWFDVIWLMYLDLLWVIRLRFNIIWHKMYYMWFEWYDLMSFVWFDVIWVDLLWILYDVTCLICEESCVLVWISKMFFWKFCSQTRKVLLENEISWFYSSYDFFYHDAHTILASF